MQHAAGTMRDNIPAGIATMIATTAVMSFGDALVKRVSADFGLWQIFVLRSLVALPLLLLLLSATRGLRALHGGATAWAALRSALLIGMWVAFYAALTKLDLATVATAYYTGPLFITLLSSWVAHEPVGPRRWLAVLAGFAGVLLILRPGGGALTWLVLLPVLSGLLYAIAAVVTRTRLAGAAPLVLSLALNVAFLIAGTVATLALGLARLSPRAIDLQPFLLGPWSPVDGQGWFVVVLLAVLIVAISTGIARAYQAAPSAIIATFDYGYLPFAVLWGFTFFGDVPDAPTLAGMVLIGGAGLFVLRSQPQRRREP